RRLVFASSSSVYGARATGSAPFRECDPAERPVSPYAATKRAGEVLLHAMHHSHGLSVTCARIFTAYGPRQRPDLAIRRFATRMLTGEPIAIYGDGSSTRDFTYVDDLVDALVRAIDVDLGFAILNIGAGRTVRLLEVVAQLERVLRTQASIEWSPVQTGDVPHTWADIAAAQAALGWQPKVGLEEGLERFAVWLQGSAA